MSDVKYAIEKYRLEKSLVEGFTFREEEGTTTLTAVANPSGNRIFLYPIDGGQQDATWGRFKFDIETSGECNYFVFAAASNEAINLEDKDFAFCEKQMVALDYSKTANANDILLYQFKGRYLHLVLEFFSEGEPDCRISHMYVDRIGDAFMGTFPRIYQERNSFFHRLISIFSSEYADMEEEVKDLPKLLDIDHCPAEVLPVYGKWLGIDTGDSFLSEEVLRTFVKEAYQLNKMKGTRACLERICEIMLGEPGIIVERNQLSEVLSPEQLREYDSMYGNSRYDVTLLLKENLTPAKRSQLEYILEQFLPVRCSLHIVELGQVNGLDAYTYLDVNAKIMKTTEASLDEDGSMDKNNILL